MKNLERRTFLKNTVYGGLGLSLTQLSSRLKKDKEIIEDLMCDETTQDYYGPGPFYTDNPPMLENFKLAGDNEPGERVIVSGRILNLECSEFIPDTIVDVWHANNAGEYDNQGYNLRGYTKSNEQGFYLFETIRPGKYLNGSKYRPSHIHFKITPPQFQSLTTQMYFEGDTDIEDDAAASITTGEYDATQRIISLTRNENDIYEGTFDIIINGDGIKVGTKDLHLNTGMIYDTSPNPFDSSVNINYGVFHRAKVGLVVFDMQGRQVAVLEDRVMAPDKYTATWNPNSKINSGYYFIAIKINDLQVHYIKVLKK